MTDSKPKRERHGMDRTPEHLAWVGMKQRCTNPKKRDFRWYGARGVTVCAAWMDSFLAFYQHIGPRPSSSHTVDRIDVNKGYEPGNVRWATNMEQKANTTVVRLVTINDRQQSISAWEREMGLPRGTVCRREASGWSLSEAILTPCVPGQKRHMNVKRDYSGRSRDGHGRYRQETA